MLRISADPYTAIYLWKQMTLGEVLALHTNSSELTSTQTSPDPLQVQPDKV
jgi:hypothetical protein